MAIALVSGQTASGQNSGSANSLAVALPNNPTSGSLVIASVFLQSGTQSAWAVADSNSNAYAASTITPWAAPALFQGMTGTWFLQNAPANATKTITFSYTGTAAVANCIAIFLAEFSGAATTSSLENETSNSTNGASTNPIILPAYTSTNDGDLYWSNEVALPTLTSANSPWTAVQSALTTGGSGYHVWSSYYIQPTHGAQAVNWSASATNSVSVGILTAFKAAPSGDTFGNNMGLLMM